jgi:REP element-mobilizing transposase RayT
MKKSAYIPEIHNRQSVRLKGWNYNSEASYFITICTQSRECYFGHIQNGKIILSEIGKIVEQEWKKTAEIRPDMNLSLKCFVIMPNHFHAILTIKQNLFNQSTNHENNGSLYYKNQFGPQSKNVASIIRGFKASVTINARLINSNFAWQQRFYDHIIKNEVSFKRIQEYIQNNPKRWKEDKFFIDENI